VLGQRPAVHARQLANQSPEHRRRVAPRFHLPEPACYPACEHGGPRLAGGKV
jgi:hypothetical protein